MKLFIDVVYLSIALAIPIQSHAYRVIVMRHGEAKQNIAKILNSDVKLSKKFPLTLMGEKQVHDAAQALKKDFSINEKDIRTIYTSPLLRARQTAELLAKDLGIDQSKVIVDDRLRENGMGRLEGHPEKELDELDPQPKGYLSRAKQLFAGETKDELTARLKEFVKQLSGSGDVIVVTHGTPAFLLLPLLDPAQEKNPEMKRGEFRVINLKASGL